MRKNNIQEIVKTKLKKVVSPTALDRISKNIAKKNGVSIKVVEKDILEKNEKYGIEYKEYYDRDLFNCSQEEFNNLIEYEKNCFAESISKIRKEAKDVVVSKMEEICNDCGVSYREYYKNKYYNMHKFSVLNMVTVYSTEYKKARIDFGVNLLGKSKGKINARMLYMKNKYGINNTEFFSHDFCYFSDSEIKKEKTAIDYPQLISQESKLTYEEAKQQAADAKLKFNITAKTYKNRLYYTMSDEEIANDIEVRKDELMEAISLAAKDAGVSLREFMLAAKLDNLKYGTTIGDFILFKMYDKNCQERETWINYDKDVRNLKRRYRIKENDILENKIKFNTTYPEYIGRKWWANTKATTYEEFCEFVSGLDEIFAKPVAGKEGKGIEKISLEKKDLKELYEKFKAQDLTIFEECIKQHDELMAFYPDCVHCCRIVAILGEDDKCYFPQTSIKFGNNAVSDNLATGSLCANIDSKTGIVCTDGVTKKGEHFECHPYSNKRIKGFKVPYWEEILALSEKMIREIPDINLIGFDIAITNDGPIIVEGNDTPDFRVFEYPLLGERTGLRYMLKPYITEYKCKW